jgi:hypothetical protein
MRGGLVQYVIPSRRSAARNLRMEGLSILRPFALFGAQGDVNVMMVRPEVAP